MLTRNRSVSSLEIISYYSGYVVLCISFLSIIPIATALIFTEWVPLLDFIITMSLSLITGITMIFIGWRAKQHKANIQWKHGYVIAAVSWVLLMFLCAIPYYLSGHTGSVLDACFDVMSGFTTTGLVLTQDLDHISISMNMWRHMLTFIGGQGMVVLALTVMVKDTSGAYRLYVGEAKDIELVPNVKGTTRLIWKISMIYLLFGTAALWIDGMLIGLKPVPAFLHALYMFESAWSTGGFAPMTQNIMYYHSLSYETISMILFVLGSLNFGLHYAVWQGNRKEIFKNIETQSFFATSTAACMLAVYVLSKSHLYPNFVSLFRRIIFNILSAHTTTGFGSIYARQFALEWGDFGILIIIIAMLIGGSACSTAGGFKGLRVGIVLQGLIMDTKKLLCSERSRKAYKFHHIKDHILDDSLVKSSSLIIICYIVLFSTGTVLGTMYGYPLSSAAFESASVTGNVGLSIGVTAPGMPNVLKIYYIIAMFMGRLEFLSVFALIGYVVGGIKKEMLKIFKTCCLILIIVLPFSISAYAAEPKNINELIEQGKSLDGQKVTIQGEAIGDAMKRGDFTWININDGSNAIGIWMKNSDAKKITNYGNYKSKGDIVQIHGIFYRACAEHGGEADIHSEKVDIIKKGYPTLVEIPYDKIVAAAILSGAALVLVILFRKKQKFTSTES